MDKLLASLYQALDMAVFVYETDQDDTSNKNNDAYDTATLYGYQPGWLGYFLRNTSAQAPRRLDTIFPYLRYFLPEANKHWQQHNGTPLTSGSWIETDETGTEVPLEATALWVNEHAILLIENLGEKYHQDVRQLQQVRDNFLVQEKLEAEIRRRTIQIRQREEEIAIKLVSLTSYRDEETGAHVKRIGMYAAAMAKALKWSQQRIDDIRIAAPMHDIGKIGIPDSILLKKGKLTEPEFSVMKRHPEIGAKMLEGSTITALDVAAEISLCHHEKWDGSGYPRGLSGFDIPITARITAIVDVYDALVHERVYNPALSEKEALETMRDMSGSHFDPDLFDLFLDLLPIMRHIRQEVHEIADLIPTY